MFQLFCIFAPVYSLWSGHTVPLLCPDGNIVQIYPNFTFAAILLNLSSPLSMKNSLYEKLYFHQRFVFHVIVVPLYSVSTLDVVAEKTLLVNS